MYTYSHEITIESLAGKSRVDPVSVQAWYALVADQYCPSIIGPLFVSQKKYLLAKGGRLRSIM